ncbi:hypothetical protein JX265_009027 [Neoarthrinium moseri]|uniref:Blue (type 1) copper domain-containing protein n=1 Tax=Neoarthrinium moseri TaxID=1658444 RepID=A0A9P9WH82_9PEZI|nr:uncharacterized protein JN550_007897 [Neoarthrinium moseri]KAI1862981.1 hypothetical protein JX265_009027 [Neoarthrinium moseri]KAI1866208.1 hypothetical protein JN550_007897 [Neoarthrinium moseri]
MKSIGILALAGAVAAEVHKIEVGGSGGLVFNPNNVRAAQGDIIEYHFYAKNHSVVQSDYDTPCQLAKSNGFYSGYFPVSDGESKSVFQITVNNTNPIWFYCSQGNHCSQGMVGVINPPADDKNGGLEDYRKKAASFTGKAGDSAAAFGGQITSSTGGTNGSTTTSPSGTATNSGSPSSTSASSSPSSTPNTAPGLQAAVGGVLGALGLTIWSLV